MSDLEKRIKIDIIECAKRINPSDPMAAVSNQLMVSVGFASTNTNPKPQKVPETTPTPNQLLCIQLAYLLYLLQLEEGLITPKQAFKNYCINFEACFPT